MNRSSYNFLACAVFLISCLFFTSSVHAQGSKWERVVSDAGTVLEEVQKMPLQGIPENLLNRCSAIAVFPSTTSAGFFIGGQYGSGIIMVRDQNSGSWSSPAIFDIAGGSSVGFQIGGENTDLIFLFMGKQSIRGILLGQYKLGSSECVLAGPLGIKSNIEAEEQPKNAVLAYYRSREVFAGMPLSGADLTENLAANKALYGSNLSAGSILAGNKANMPKSAAAMIKALKTSI